MRRPVSRATQDKRRIARLKDQNKALRKTVRALMARVEREFDEHAGAFSWFQAAARLEDTVRLRTEQYESLNAQLTRELESRREIELALKQAKQLADSGNQAKTRFLAAASHDLRQPLNSALLFLESMDDGQLVAANRELLQRAKVALASLNNLLGMARSCRRFLILDLIRHPMPLALFSVFLSPLIGEEAAADGKQSIRRAFTTEEFSAMVQEALAGTGGTFTVDVPPLFVATGHRHPVLAIRLPEQRPLHSPYRTSQRWPDQSWMDHKLRQRKAANARKIGVEPRPSLLTHRTHGRHNLTKTRLESLILVGAQCQHGDPARKA